MMRANSQFTFDLAGIAAAFLGGDEAISAMATVLFSDGHQWTRWYNTPGSFEIARRFSSFMKKGETGSSQSSPLAMLGLEGAPGPKYRALHSGTIMAETSHIAYLLAKECEARQETMKVSGRETTPAWVTVVTLGDAPGGIFDIPTQRPAGPLGVVPVVVSICAAMACLLGRDLCSALVILIGCLANGFSGLLIGSAAVTFKHPIPAPGCPPGDGVLMANKGMIILRGAEGAVNAITRGQLSLQFKSESDIGSAGITFGICSLLFTLQFFAQLLFVPQGTLFGQTMFLVSLGASWLHNFYLASFDNEKIRSKILLDQVMKKPCFKKYVCGTRTSMAVFGVLVLNASTDVDYVKKYLKELIPNDTRVWRRWRATVANKIAGGDKLHFGESDWIRQELSEDEQALLKTLFGDASAAYDCFHYTERVIASQKSASEKKDLSSEVAGNEVKGQQLHPEKPVSPAPQRARGLEEKLSRMGSSPVGYSTALSSSPYPMAPSPFMPATAPYSPTPPPFPAVHTYQAPLPEYVARYGYPQQGY